MERNTPSPVKSSTTASRAFRCLVAPASLRCLAVGSVLWIGVALIARVLLADMLATLPLTLAGLSGAAGFGVACIVAALLALFISLRKPSETGSAFCGVGLLCLPTLITLVGMVVAGPEGRAALEAVLVQTLTLTPLAALGLIALHSFFASPTARRKAALWLTETFRSEKLKEQRHAS